MGSLYIESGGTYTATSGTTTITSINSSSGNRSFRLNSGGTFTHNSGTVYFNSTSQQNIGGVSDNTLTFHNITTAGNHTVQIRDCDIVVANDLTVAADVTFTHEQVGDSITVTGDVSVSGTLNCNIESGGVYMNPSFGSLTINSGGTYSATSGTTTLTSTSSNYSINNAGTFTHNNGTVKIDFETPNYNANSKIKLNELYNLEVEMNRTTDSTLLEPVSGTTLTALNNVTVKKGVLTKNSHTHTLDFKGLTVVGVGGGSLAAHIDASTSGSATSNFGALTILTDGKYTQSTTTNVSSIRNVGGTIA